MGGYCAGNLTKAIIRVGEKDIKETENICIIVLISRFNITLGRYSPLDSTKANIRLYLFYVMA